MAASSSSEGYPGAVAVSMPVALPVAVASAMPVTVAATSTVYSHDPQPAYRPAAEAPRVAEIEMRPLATPTAIMYPTLSNNNGYARVESSEV